MNLQQTLAEALLDAVDIRENSVVCNIPRKSLLECATEATNNLFRHIDYSESERRLFAKMLVCLLNDWSNAIDWANEVMDNI